MNRSPDNAPESTPFTKPGFVLSVLLGVTCIAAGVVIFLLPAKDDSAQSAVTPTFGSSNSTSEAPGPSASTGTNNVERKSACGLPPTDELALDTAPISNWKMVDGMATPRDPISLGPGIMEESGFRPCFASSPAAPSSRL